MKNDIRSITETALCAALIAVSAMISIPFPVPFTMQLFGVFFALFYLGARRGLAAVAIYVAIGAVGLPVFSGFSGGVGRLFDATGGFIFGFLLLAFVYLVFERFLKVKYALAIGATAALAAFYAIGSVWYCAFYTDAGISTYFASLLITVAPFVLPDAVKICLAYALAERLSRIFRKKASELQKKD